MSDSVDRVFVHALNTVKRIPRTGSARPPEFDRLKLYGLYKQSMEGDVEGVMRRPPGISKEELAERDKWEAWHSHAGLSRTEAKRQYISTLIDTMHRYATTTPEARELVSELEFVWDQIKSNSTSSAGSSPGQLAISHRLHQRHQEADGMRRQGGNDGEDLRALRPSSDGDAEEEEEVDTDEFEEAQHETLDDGEAVATVPTRPLSRILDVRKRKWRKRMEQALVKLTVEVAALREQLETQRMNGGRRHNGARAWVLWLFWTSLRHIIVDAALTGCLIVWARRKSDHRVEQSLRFLFLWFKEQMSKLKIPQAIKMRAKPS